MPEKRQNDCLTTAKIGRQLTNRYLFAQDDVFNEFAKEIAQQLRF
jgi:hypothetical protein